MGPLVSLLRKTRTKTPSRTAVGDRGERGGRESDQAVRTREGGGETGQGGRRCGCIIATVREEQHGYARQRPLRAGCVECPRGAALEHAAEVPTRVRVCVASPGIRVAAALSRRRVALPHLRHPQPRTARGATREQSRLQSGPRAAAERTKNGRPSRATQAVVVSLRSRLGERHNHSSSTALCETCSHSSLALRFLCPLAVSWRCGVLHFRVMKYNAPPSIVVAAFTRNPLCVFFSFLLFFEGCIPALTTRHACGHPAWWRSARAP